MAAKRKISIRKILQVFLTLVVTTCCIIAMVSASKIEDGKRLKSVAIHFKNDKKYHIIEEKEIMDLAINNRHTDIAHTPISKLDIHTMEQLIMSDPWVANAQVFIDNERVLHIYVTQRIPVVRVFQKDSRSYYMDTTLSIMPLSANYIYYTTVVTNVPEMKNDSTGRTLRKNIISLVRTIQADSFWNAQVSQVIVDSVCMFELVPILGDHRILFGDASGMKEKFNNLFIFYKNVLNRIGWDKYQTLDIRFNGQVVASPSLPYNGPIDTKVNTMNWINSIVETEAINDSKDPVSSAEKDTTDRVINLPAKVMPLQKHIVTATAKGSVKTPPKKIQKQKIIANNKNRKKQTPKYVYPDKKNH